MGWILSAIGLLQAVNVFTHQYGVYAFVTKPGSLPFRGEIVWLAFWSWMLSLSLLLTFLLLLFPTGHPPSPRWRWVEWLSATGIALIVVSVSIAAWPVRNSGLEAVPRGAELVRGSILVAAVAGVFVVLVGAIASVASLVVRYRRSRGDERQQLKWFTYAGALAFAAIASAFLPLELPEFVVGVGIAIVPVAVGIAILRYRLYDIDVIVNRTLVYVALSAILGVTYFGLVVLLQLIFGAVTPESDLAVAGSTLTVAALFRPARARIQGFIDLRFYRRKYDAVKTLEAFAARLRNEVDLDAISTALLNAATETVQPVHVSLWLRAPGHSGGEGP